MRVRIHSTNTNGLGYIMEKKIGRHWYYYGLKSGFGIGFDVSKYFFHIDLGFWYVGIEF
jgi:hypothetical protein